MWRGGAVPPLPPILLLALGFDCECCLPGRGFSAGLAFDYGGRRFNHRAGTWKGGRRDNAGGGGAGFSLIGGLGKEGTVLYKAG